MGSSNTSWTDSDCDTGGLMSLDRVFQWDGAVRDVDIPADGSAFWGRAIRYVTETSEEWEYTVNGEPSPLPADPEEFFVPNGTARILNWWIADTNFRTYLLDSS